ncbi:MAG: M42 family peptidase [Planctomycetes bacterium]|nr:M42 family peptidase [Planctomycetota bacterium]
MHESSYRFLEELLTAPGPSGYEQPVQEVVRRFARGFTDDVRTDWHGNVVAAVNPQGSPRIMLAGHCDQIGLLVKHIDEAGFLRVHAIGGWDMQILLGQRVQVWTAAGAVGGVIARKAIHLMKDEDRKKVPELHELWVDIGTTGEAESRELVAIGDPVTLELGVRRLRNNLISSPGTDNRVGVWVVMNALRLAAEASPKAALFAVSTVQEEIGLRGARTSAFAIDPQLGIAVDVTHATDTPDVDANQHGRVLMGRGPSLASSM